MKKIVPVLIPGLLLLFISSSAIAQQSSNSKSSEAKVTLTEYSDFQCPTCQYYYPMVKKLKAEYGDNLKIVYKHFPINSHQYAAMAARASEAARAQGKFKEMHDLLFENQSRWAYSVNPQPIFEGFAKELNLNIEKFREDLNSTEMQRKVMEEKKEGRQRGVGGTPTFFVNGDMVDQLPPTYEAFKAIIDRHMKKSK